MKEIYTTQINDLVIEGIAGDYVFETIRSKNTFYESSLLEKWIPLVQNSKNILDIGANLGNHTLYFAKNIAYDSIYSFEPYSVNYERLCNNINNNHLANVYPINKGIGSHKGYTEVKDFTEENYGATSLDTNITDNGDIEITDIDSFIVENNLQHIDFIKIDTEGFEEQVLVGMSKTIETYHPDFWIEITEQTFENVANLLLSKDYVIADIEGFNIMFLYSKRHPEATAMDMTAILKQTFHHLTRVNKYYANYMTAKKWHENDLQNIAKLKEQLIALFGEKDVVEKELKSLNLQLQDYTTEREMFIELAQAQDEYARALLRAKRTIQKQQRELQILREENEGYKQRWNRFSNKWYGKFALKCYYKLRIWNVLR